MAVFASLLFSWLCLLTLEHVIVSVAYAPLFAGSWEGMLIRTHVMPIAFACLIPAAAGGVFIVRIGSRASRDARARIAMAVLAGLFGAAVAWGVSNGRHFAAAPFRLGFALVLTLAGGAIGFWGSPVLSHATRHPRRWAALGIVVSAAAWACDAWVLARLYPAFHLAMLAVALGSGAAVALLWQGSPFDRWMTRGMSALAIVSLLWAPVASKRLAQADNVRLILSEHAPIMGRAIAIASLFSQRDGESSNAAVAVAPVADQKTLDWTGRDIVLISIDALRADHVSAYGYARRTTPNIDALAQRGALFEQAYCATPHTSYSVTSLMTGKYMRPLLALGLGEDSETWAGALRRYGFKTAAFYPPAVFYIDAERFRAFEARGLDFEYKKVEFAAPALRQEQVAAYLRSSPTTEPLFLWVHFFEPHEPYVAHPEFPFGGSTVDAYDSEIAAADDGVGRIVRLVEGRGRRPVIIVTADHGEEFGEHGGRYHGTSVYAEQVRVPLVIAGAGIATRRVSTPVQTIDLLPTVLRALDVPRSPRMRGQDMGSLLMGQAQPKRVAFAETDEYARLTQGTESIVCARKIGACRLFDLQSDAHETKDRGPERAQRLVEMKARMRELEGAHGTFEAGESAMYPEALRRALAGDRDAAEDAATLLDDVNPLMRAKAAEALYALRVPAVRVALERALMREEDQGVRAWASLALTRVGGDPNLDALAQHEDIAWRRRVALCRAERGDARGEGELVSWWAALVDTTEDGVQIRDHEAARDLLGAFRTIKSARAVPMLASSLPDVRLRPAIAETLGAIGDPRTAPRLLTLFASERYVHARGPEARALLRLGVREELREPLRAFAGMPEPMQDALPLAVEAGFLAPKHQGWSSTSGASDAAIFARRAARPQRLLVWADGEVDVRIDDTPAAAPQPKPGSIWTLDIDRLERDVTVSMRARTQGVIRAAWLVPKTEDLPPPPPRVWSPDAAAPKSPD